ncbi:Pun1 protein [Martiniozyma asiatica (nom. inval.)]|nr:Pun1 protein [Martiniozyma asiatica]
MCGTLFRFIFITLVSLGALALLLAANVGTVKNEAAKSSIFLLEMNFANAIINKILPTEYSSYSLNALGFSDAYIFGMYSYCRGTQGTSTTSSNGIWEDIHFAASECTKPSLSYEFNPIEFVVDQINNYNTLGLTISSSDITLPGELNTYISIADAVSKAIYICSIIAIILGVVALLCEYLCCFCGGGLITCILQAGSFIAAIISSGCATGMYRFISIEFNKYSDDFGIHTQLSRNYLVLTWVGTALSLVALIFMIVGHCCCGVAQSVPKFQRVVV